MKNISNSENPRPIVNVDSGLKALEVPRLVVPSENLSEATGLGKSLDPVGIVTKIRQIDEEFLRSAHCLSQSIEVLSANSQAESGKPIQYTGHVPCKKCGTTHWMHGPCPQNVNVDSGLEALEVPRLDRRDGSFWDGPFDASTMAWFQVLLQSARDEYQDQFWATLSIRPANPEDKHLCQGFDGVAELRLNPPPQSSSNHSKE